MRKRGSFRRKSVILLVALALVSALLSIASNQYSVSVSAKISDLSIQEINSNSQIQASELSYLLQKNLQGVASNVEIIANSNAVTTQNLTAAMQIFTTTQNSSKDLTYTYFWLDNTGRLLLVSNGTVYPPGTGSDLGGRNYFVVPKENGTTFFSSATPSLRNTSNDFIFISQPVFAESVTDGRTTKAFEGVVGAAIDLHTLGSYLQGEISTNFRSFASILDFNGTILYSTNESMIGSSVFASTFQNSLPSSLKAPFDSFLYNSLQGSSGVQELSYNGTSSTLAYQPVLVNDSSGRVQKFGVLYIVAPDTLTGDAIALINQQQLINMVIIIGIGAAFLATALTIIRWNKQLEDAVKEKTADLVAVNQQLEEQSKSQRDLINIAAHELRTPTQSILANAELLQSALTPELSSLGVVSSSSSSSSEFELVNIDRKEVSELIASTFRNSQRLEKLTQTLLDVAKIDNKAVKFQTENFDINDVISRVIEDVRNIGTTDERYPKRVSISFEPKDSLIKVYSDSTKTAQIISNLLGNALKYSRKGGIITITTEKSEGYALVKIIDEGTGIDPEILPHLFNKFVTKSGTGLGLYISKSYVEALGGKIWAENNADGKGATFNFTLPLVSQTTQRI